MNLLFCEDEEVTDEEEEEEEDEAVVGKNKKPERDVRYSNNLVEFSFCNLC